MKERLYTAISGGIPDRVPVVPKIWVDLAARLTGTDLLEVVSDLATALRVIVEAGLMCGVDAVLPRTSSGKPRRAFRKPARGVDIFSVPAASCLVIRGKRIYVPCERPPVDIVKRVENMRTPIRFAIVGTGNMARVHAMA